MQKNRRKPLQFGLRLFLLIVALCAVCFAWLSALRTTAEAERLVRKWNLEARLLHTERWYASNRAELNIARQKYVQDEIAQLRGELEALK